MTRGERWMVMGFYAAAIIGMVALLWYGGAFDTLFPSTSVE